MGSPGDREVACSPSDRQGSNFESCVWRAVSSHSYIIILRRFSWPSLVYMCTINFISYYFKFSPTKGYASLTQSTDSSSVEKLFRSIKLAMFRDVFSSIFTVMRHFTFKRCIFEVIMKRWITLL